MKTFVGSLFVVLAAGLVTAGGGSPKPPATREEPRSPADQAAEQYNFGLASRDDAWRLEKKLAAAPAEQRERIEKKIARAYELSAERLEKAVRLDPDMHEAWGSLGYALRKSGRIDDALDAYDRSLSLRPDYAPALEYRAEAHLEQNRIDDALSGHARLLDVDPDLAGELRLAMRGWLEARRKDSRGVDESRLDELEGWLEDQGELPEKSRLRKSRAW